MLAVLAQSSCATRDASCLSPDLAHARAAQAADHLPILALLLGQDEPLPIDLAHWVQSEPALLPRAHVVVLWRDEGDAQSVASLANGSFLARLPRRPGDAGPAAPGGVDASLYPLPRAYADCRQALAAAAAGLPPPPGIDLRLGEEALFDATRMLLTSWATPSVQQIAAFSHQVDLALSRRLDVGHALLLALGISLEHDHAHIAKLMSELWEQLPQAHDTFEIELTLADCLVGVNDLTGATTAYRRIAQAEAQAPVVAAAARSQLANLQVDASSSRRHFEDRAAQDVVVLVPDLRTYLAAVAAWTPDRFYPVMLDEDRYASRFIAAYHPHQVLRMPPVAPDAGGQPPGAQDAPGIELLARTVIRSWGAGPAADASLEGQRRQLDRLGIVPDGLVVIDPAAPEAAGALALAAGRFQGLAAIGSPGIGSPARPATIADRLDATVAAGFARLLEGRLDAFAPRQDGWRFLTLGGRYPYRWIGPDSNDSTYAVDDLIGRDRDSVRTAVVGRLAGDQVQAIYQAMCSLFLQPKDALLVDTYIQNPYSTFGRYRLAPIRASLEGVVRADLLVQPTIAAMRARATPWCSAGLVMITSAGGPDWWMIPGSGTAEDIPIGAAHAMIMDHSYSCADPYDPDTIAGRALWGGAYLYFGSVSEPMLDAFEDASYIGPRLRLALPWSTVLRTHGGDWGQQPRKLMLVGDPRFALRLHAQAREPARFSQLEQDAVVQPESGTTSLTRLRTARLVGAPDAIRAALAGLDPPSLDAGGLVLGLDSSLLVDDLAGAQRLYDAAPRLVRENPDALRLGRIASLCRLDRAVALEDLAAAQAALAQLLDQHPPAKVLERSLGQLGDVAGARHQEEPHAAWLRAQAALPANTGSATLLEAWAERAALSKLLALPSWRDVDAEAAVAALVAVARCGTWNDSLAGWVDTACQRWSSSSGDGPDQIIAGLTRKPMPGSSPWWMRWAQCWRRSPTAATGCCWDPSPTLVTAAGRLWRRMPAPSIRRPPSPIRMAACAAGSVPTAPATSARSTCWRSWATTSMSTPTPPAWSTAPPPPTAGCCWARMMAPPSGWMGSGSGRCRPRAR